MRPAAVRPQAPRGPLRARAALPALALLVAACGADAPARPAGATLTIAAVGEPATLLPPLVADAVGRDIGDLVFERLATLPAGASPLDPRGYRPGLAASWERIDSLAWRLRLRDARWHDGRPVTAGDVAFSFAAYADSVLDAPARPDVQGIVATPEDARTVRLTFPRAYPEQLYDATWHVRILPAHVWGAVPRARWAADTALARLVGSGPYRVRRWVRGASLELARADTTAAGPAIARLLWRFAADPQAVADLLLAREADLAETVQAPDAKRRLAADTAFRLLPYPSAVYGFVGFRVADARGRPHPVLGTRALREALAGALDRAALVRNVFGDGAEVTDGPWSSLLWVGRRPVAAPPDTARAAFLLDSLGWRRGTDGVRRRGAARLAFGVLVPATSATRRQLALALQAAWARLGADVRVEAVDFAVFQSRLAAGTFDAHLGAWLDEPSPRGLVAQWTRAGFGGPNPGRYDSPAVDSLLSRAGRANDPMLARALYGTALDSLVADHPAVFLYTLTNTAVVSRRLDDVQLDPYGWLGGVAAWRLR